MRLSKIAFLFISVTGLFAIPGCGPSGNTVVEQAEVEVSPEVQKLDEQEAAQR